MVCRNEEELGAHICRVVSPRLDVDADMIFLKFTQIFALGQCPECKISLFFWAFFAPPIGINHGLWEPGGVGSSYWQGG